MKQTPKWSTSGRGGIFSRKVAGLEKGRESSLHEDKGAQQAMALWAHGLPMSGLRAVVGDPHMTLIMKDRGSGHVHHIGRVEHRCTRSLRKNILNLKHKAKDLGLNFESQ